MKSYNMFAINGRVPNPNYLHYNLLCLEICGWTPYVAFSICYKSCNFWKIKKQHTSYFFDSAFLNFVYFDHFCYISYFILISMEYDWEFFNYFKDAIIKFSSTKFHDLEYFLLRANKLTEDILITLLLFWQDEIINYKR